jgi:hypothetical protein
MLSSSSVKLMVSSYGLRDYSSASNKRTTLPDGTVLTSNKYGPDVDATYPVGSYLQDYMYNQGTGDLDAYNGRLCVTPEYPLGTYAYFVTVTLSNGVYTPAYPFIIGPSFYGAPVSSNMGPGSGTASVSESTTVFYSYY